MLPYNIIYNENKVVSLKFPGELSYMSFKDQFMITDHEAIAAQINEREMSCGSVIILCDLLKDSLYRDPVYMKIDHHMCVSKLLEHCRERMNNKYWDKEEIIAKANELEIPLVPNNYCDKDSEEAHKYFSKLWDELCEAQALSHIPDIVFSMKTQSKYGYNEDTEEEFELPEEEAETAFRKDWEEMCLPRSYSRANRVSSMPPPFSHYDYRNPVQQFFFVYDSKNNTVMYTYGGSGGSLSREHQGRYGHTFAYLTDKYNYTIPTTILRYNESNELVFEKEYSTFKVINRELSGNYWVDMSKTRELFKNKLLTYSRDWNVDSKINLTEEEDVENAF